MHDLATGLVPLLRVHPPVILRGSRITLRPWKNADRRPFARLNADAEVMRYFPGILTREQSDILIERLATTITSLGWGLWAAELNTSRKFIGCIGLNIPSFSAPFMPAIEICWRLDHCFWGQGLAREGAILAANFGFKQLKLKEIVSFSTSLNSNSRRLMEKLGMQYSPIDNFDHPALAATPRLLQHVLYRLPRERFFSSHISH